MAELQDFLDVAYQSGAEGHPCPEADGLMDDLDAYVDQMRTAPIRIRGCDGVCGYRSNKLIAVTLDEVSGFYEVNARVQSVGGWVVNSQSLTREHLLNRPLLSHLIETFHQHLLFAIGKVEREEARKLWSPVLALKLEEEE